MGFYIGLKNIKVSAISGKIAVANGRVVREGSFLEGYRVEEIDPDKGVLVLSAPFVGRVEIGL